MNDLINRQAAVVQLYHNKTGDDDVDVIIERDIATIQTLPPVIPAQGWKPLNNMQWIDFLAKAWDISRTSAKDMLHVMMSVKKEDNFKKQFSGAKMKEADDK